MKKNKIICIFAILLLFVLIPATTYATNNKNKKTDIDNIIENMKNVGNVSEVDTTKGIPNVINSVIKLIQVAGSGVAVIVVTLLGVKYMIASSNEKADIKKQAIPIVIGCVLLFAAVNIVGIIADLGNGMN